MLTVAGIFRELRFSSLWKKGFLSACIFVVILGIFFIADYIGVTQFKQPPIYRYKTTTAFDDSKLIEYQNLFYNVYRINADTPNEYYLIDTKKQYTIDTVPTNPFNLDISAMKHLIQYQSKYVGDHSNIGQLIGTLPLSEYALVYNSDSAIALIENLKYITFNFSGSSYSVTREAIEKNYPNYEDIFAENSIDAEKFSTYVEQKMNDSLFVSNVFKQFDKE